MNEILAGMLSDAWAMEPRRLEEFIAAAARLDVSAARPSPYEPAPLAISNGKATIQIHGPIMRSEIPILRFFGLEHTGAAQVRDLVLQAAMDQSVTEVELDIDSPGGQVGAAREIAEDVYALRSLGKRVTAKSTGMMASAAYWIGSQADHVSASASTLVGAIGTYMPVVDSSRMAESAGIKIHVVSSHPLKGQGVPGAPVTEAQLADMQRVVDTWARMFTSDIERGRPGRVKDMDGAATGQVWVGGEARLMGLIDAVSPSPVATTQQQRTTGAPTARAMQESTTMDEEKLKAELAAKDAELAKIKAKIAADEANQKAQILAKHADRYLPAAQSAFEAMAAVMSPAGLEAHMAALPKIANPKPGGSMSAPPAVSTAGRGIAALTGVDPFTREEVGGQAGADQVARLLGTSVDVIDRYADVECGYSNGTFKMRDGRIVTAAELKKMKAA